MKIKDLYGNISDRSYKLKYIYFYIGMLLVTISAYDSGIPWFGLSIIAGAISLLLCGAHPFKSIETFKDEISKSGSSVKIFLVENNVLIFVIILPFIFKMIIY